MTQTYKDLFQLVQEQIVKNLEYRQTDRYRNQLGRNDVAPIFSNPISDVRTGEIVTSIQTLLEGAIPPWIKSGLDVEATDPESSSVIVRSGTGAKGGFVYTLAEDTTIPIPYDNSTEIYFIGLYKDRILITKNEEDRVLTLAKIIVPNPSKSYEYFNFKIYNRREDREDNWEPYIIGYKEWKLYGNQYGEFEEDSIDLLRNNISPILADNLIGNILLSEDLKIINTQGTLQLDSSSLKLYDENENLNAKFNRYGIFFYDTNNIELARFTRSDARVGNIVVDKNSIHSDSYVSESSGFKIQDNGFAEFDNVRVRGRISSSVFEYDKVSAIGGKLLVGNSSVISVDMTSSDIGVLTTEDDVFSTNDILYIKEGNNEEYMRISADSGSGVYTVVRDLANVFVSNSNPQWKKGTAIVSTGSGVVGTTSGFIKLDAVSQYSPFIDIILRNSTDYNDLNTKVRLGNLQGISDSLYGNLSGYGLYSDNVYLKGSLYAPDIKTAISGTRIELNTEGLFMYDADNKPVFSALLDTISGSSAVGDIIFGDVDSGTYVKWDNGDRTLTVKGIINGEDIIANTINGSSIIANTIAGDRLQTNSISSDKIQADAITADKISVANLSAISSDLGTLTAGTITGLTVQTAISGSRVVMTDTAFIAYNDSEEEIFKIMLDGSGGVLGEITFGNIAKGYMQWDNLNDRLIVSDIESPDYIIGTTGYKLSASSGLEVNTGDIKSEAITNFAIEVAKISAMIQFLIITDVN